MVEGARVSGTERRAPPTRTSSTWALGMLLRAWVTRRTQAPQCIPSMWSVSSFIGIPPIPIMHPERCPDKRARAGVEGKSFPIGSETISNAAHGPEKDGAGGVLFEVAALDIVSLPMGNDFPSTPALARLTGQRSG